MNSNDIQKKNRMLVFQTLLSSDGMTRSQLARATKLKKGTITNIINEFAAKGIVPPLAENFGDKRGEQISLALHGIYLMAISITRRDYQIMIYSLDGKANDYIKYSFLPNEKLQDSLVRMMEDGKALLKKYDPRRVMDICLTVPGPYMKLKDGTEVFAVSKFDDFNSINIRSQLEAALGRHIYIVHDTKLCAYAEWQVSPEVQNGHADSMLVVGSRGEGVGCGIVINGKIIEGHIGVAGEVGFMGVNYNQPPDHGGSYMACASSESIAHNAADRLIEFPDTVLSEQSSYEDVIKAYRKGDKLAKAAIRRTAILLGYGLANIVYMVNPSVIIIGADYPSDTDFLDTVKKSMNRYLLPVIAKNVILRGSTLASDSFLVGAYYYMASRELEKDDFFERIDAIENLDR